MALCWWGATWYASCSHTIFTFQIGPNLSLWTAYKLQLVDCPSTKTEACISKVVKIDGLAVLFCDKSTMTMGVCLCALHAILEMELYTLLQWLYSLFVLFHLIDISYLHLIFVFIFPHAGLKPAWENTMDRGCAAVLGRKVLVYDQGHIDFCLVVYNYRDWSTLFPWVCLRIDW